MSDFKSKFNQANGRLTRDKSRLKIISRKDRLYLQGTLPSPPGHRNPNPHQCQLPLHLAAESRNLPTAERRAREVSLKVEAGLFDWSEFRAVPVETPVERTIGDWLCDFERDFWLRHPGKETLWKKDYWSVLKKLPFDEPFTEFILLDLVSQSDPTSKTRKRTCMALGAIAKFAGFPIDLSRYRGSYGIQELNPRDIPSDEDIFNARRQITSTDWLWAYGILAAYGIRPHELNYCEFGVFPELLVTKGKTSKKYGTRIVYPVHADWADKWRLKDECRPQISGKDNSALGARVNQAFKRANIPFNPYDLRHAWGARTIGLLPVELAALQMGHSVDIHTRIYHRWLSSEVHRQAFEKYLKS